MNLFLTFIDFFIPLLLWFALWLGTRASPKRIFTHYLVTFFSLLALSGSVLLVFALNPLLNSLLITETRIHYLFILLSSALVAFLVLGADKGILAYEAAAKRFPSMKREFFLLFVVLLLFSFAYKPPATTYRFMIDLTLLGFLAYVFYLVGTRLRLRSGTVTGSISLPLSVTVFASFLLIGALLWYSLSTAYSSRDFLVLVDHYKTRLQETIPPSSYALLDRNIETNHTDEIILLLKLEELNELENFLKHYHGDPLPAFYIFEAYSDATNVLSMLSNEPSVTLPVTPRRILDSFRSSLEQLRDHLPDEKDLLALSVANALSYELSLTHSSPILTYGSDLATLLFNLSDLTLTQENELMESALGMSNRAYHIPFCLTTIKCYKVARQFVFKDANWTCDEALRLLYDTPGDKGLCLALFDENEILEVERYLRFARSCGSGLADFLLRKDLYLMEENQEIMKLRREVVANHCRVLDMNLYDILRMNDPD